MEPTAASLLAISDVGGWLTADVTYDGGRRAGLDERAARAAARRSRTPAPGQARAGRRRSHAARRLHFERHAARSASSACTGSAAIPIRNGEVQAPTGYLEAASRSQAHGRQPGHRGARGAARAAPQRLGRGLRRALHARQRLSHGLDLGAAAASRKRVPAAGYRRLQHHRRGRPGRRRPAGARALFPLDRRREDAPAAHPGGRDRARRAHRRAAR